MKGVQEVFELAVNTAVGHEIAVREQESSRTSGRSGRKTKKKQCTIL